MLPSTRAHQATSKRYKLLFVGKMNFNFTTSIFILMFMYVYCSLIIYFRVLCVSLSSQLYLIFHISHLIHSVLFIDSIYSMTDDKPKPHKEWGRYDDSDRYDQNSYNNLRDEDRVHDEFGDADPYDGDGGFPDEGDGYLDDFTGDYEQDTETNAREADRIAKGIIQREFPGLDDPIMKKKAIESLGNLAYVGCAQLAVFSGIQGIILGGVLGAVQTGFAGAAQGMFRQPGFGRFVFQQAKLQGKQFGVWLACFSGMKCSLTLARGGVQDIVTVFGSGFVAGSVSTLYSRNPPLIAMNGLGSGIIVSVLHLVGFGL